MYVVNVSCGDVDDEPDMALTETIGTYESLDKACEAAASKFDAVMESLEALELRCREVREGRYDYYVVYGRYYPAFGCVLSEYYYMITVFEI